MKAVMKNDVARREQAFIAAGYPTQSIGCREQQFTYYVLPPEMLPEFKGFTFALVAEGGAGGDPATNAVFGVSTDVPEEFREHVVRFEILFRWFRMTMEESVKTEMRIVAASEFRHAQCTAYCLWRERHFERLIPFAREHGESEQVLQEYENARQYFYGYGQVL